MATITQIRQAGATLTLPNKSLYEPLDAAATLGSSVVDRFGDAYNLTTSSHLYRVLLALCGDAGAGAIKKEALIGRLQSNLESTHFSNLDKFYGSPLGLTRLSDEIYETDPTQEVLTSDQWQEILAKDASYRARCLKWMRAIMLGPTPAGLKLAGEAALGYECDIIERYKYIENLSSDAPLPLENIGDTNSRNEFVLVARIPEVTEAERRRAIRLVDRLKPSNSIPSIVGGDFARVDIAVQDVDATSERFNLVRYVTGRNDIAWPDIEPAKGYWISQDENEAPTLPFLDKQESITYLSVIDITASSEHVGNFNKDQRNLFSHLAFLDAGIYTYGADNAIAQPFAPIFATAGWTGGAARNIIMVNNYYPIDYFTLADFTNDFTPSPIFWSSVEKDAPEQDFLIVDFGSSRPINYVEFEISDKPVDFIIEYEINNNVWEKISPKPNQMSMSASYLSAGSSWINFHQSFDLISTRRLRITFIRRTQPFPFDNSVSFPWSIDVRNMRLAHAVSNINDVVQPIEAQAVNDLPPTGGQSGRYIFLNRPSGGWPGKTALQWDGTQWVKAFYLNMVRGVNTVTLYVPMLDQGVDILGNIYRTDLVINEADNTLDEDSDTFWLSQPNPSPAAVEAIYFDLRLGWEDTTMKYLDQFFDDNLDGMTMQDMEHHATDGVIIDEIYIDPLTIGPTMHIYYSTDTNANWEDKLWTPIPKTFILQRGTYAFERPTWVKFIKLEFSNLTPTPYMPIDYPAIEPVQFRRFPTWVQQFFYEVNFNVYNIFAGTSFDRISLDPLALGFLSASDKLDSSYAQIRAEEQLGEDIALKSFVGSLQQSRDPQLITRLESQIEFNSPIIWQTDLTENLDLSRAESRMVNQLSSAQITTQDLSWSAEQALPPVPVPQEQSGDLTVARQEKEAPDMWFPFTCRHAYQVVEADRPKKVAYQVGIKDVSFYRRDYTASYDESVYFETLEDEVHTQVNEFVQVDWRWQVEE